MKRHYADFFSQSQREICTALEALGEKEPFLQDSWERPVGSSSLQGGGRTGILSGGDIFERAGVSYSEVWGVLTPEQGKRIIGAEREVNLFATGLSLVLHPLSPMVPTTHANVRYLEIGEKAWFGGGMDLTPYYLFEEDAIHFHQTIKNSCDLHNKTFYQKFKRWCDEYFFLPHRNETRGIGGIFFDYLGREDPELLPSYWKFMETLPSTFLEAYRPIVERRRSEPWGDEERTFQLLRRGRYVEFNLLYDRGTQFGLATGGRTESILMSLPPTVNWIYNYEPSPGSQEEALMNVLHNPREWV